MDYTDREVNNVLRRYEKQVIRDEDRASVLEAIAKELFLNRVKRTKGIEFIPQQTTNFQYRKN